MVIPDGTHHVRRIRLPWLALPVLILLLVGAVGTSAYWFQEYQDLSRQLPHLKTMQQQVKQQQTQIKTFADRLTQFTRQMSKLKFFNHKLRVMANLETASEPEAFLGVGGPENTGGGPGIKLSQTAGERRLSAMTRDLDKMAVEAELELQVQEELAKFLKEHRSVLASTPSIWPVRGWVSSGFGYRISPFTGKRQYHQGLDISNQPGTQIKAPADGVVTFAGVEGGYGKMLIVNHGHGMVTRYGHLRKFNTKVGQKVKRGQVIGFVGNSGRSSGPHLHYEVLRAGSAVNPRHYILD